MAASRGETTGTIHPAEGEYLEWSAGDAPVSVQIHFDAVDGIGRDVIEGFRTTPEFEVGGLLLGRLEEGDHPTVRIERYQRIPCGHRASPHFVLDREDQTTLEAAAEEILKAGDLSIVGLYRSHMRPGLQLEVSDLELMGRYFSDPGDLMLLIKPASLTDISARFFRREAGAGAQPIGAAFPFRGRGLNLSMMNGDQGEKETEPTTDRGSDARERPRRLVPDFVPSAVVPSHTLRPEPPLPVETSSTARTRRSWWPLLAAILLVGAGAWLVLQPNRHLPSNNLPKSTAPAAERPLGLYVDPVGDAWRVSWNPNATALQDARAVRLFVREGDDQNRVDLSPGDLASGIYQYRSSGNANDVTFRLEATENSGQISSESFRVLRATAPAARPTAPAPAPAVPTARVIEPRAIHRVPPVVPLSIKPRIKGAIPIDVRVHIDTTGRVTSAAPVVKQPSGLHAYLAGRAVEAARLWRFEPARQNGKAVPGTETIHFVFEN